MPALMKRQRRKTALGGCLLALVDLDSFRQAGLDRLDQLCARIDFLTHRKSS